MVHTHGVRGSNPFSATEEPQKLILSVSEVLFVCPHIIIVMIRRSCSWTRQDLPDFRLPQKALKEVKGLP